MVLDIHSGKSNASNTLSAVGLEKSFSITLSELIFAKFVGVREMGKKENFFAVQSSNFSRELIFADLSKNREN